MAVKVYMRASQNTLDIEGLWTVSRMKPWHS